MECEIKPIEGGTVMSKRRVLLVVIVAVCLAAVSFGQAPNLISYQGRLVSSSGVPLASGTYDMDFILWDDQSVGTARYTEQHRTADAVTVTGGLFNVTLGGITAFPANLLQAYPQLWMEVVLDPTGTPETFSRVRVVSVPFALEAKHLEGVNATAAQLNELVGGGVTTLHSHPPGAHNHFAAVWSGANAGASGLSVTNTDTTANSSGLRGVSGAPQAGIASPVAAGLRGESSTAFGVIGMSDGTAGVWGSTFSTNGLMAGVYGVSYDVPQGVFGLSAMGNGVVGWSNDAAGSGANAANGVYGMTNSTDATEAGVYGLGAGACGVKGVSTDSYGVYGESTDWDGVRGVSTGAGIADNGVFGGTNSTDSGEAGVLGNSSDAACGVYGYNSGTGIGVRAYSLTSVGLYSESGGTDFTDYAIYGVQNAVWSNTPAIVGESADGNGVEGISTGAGYADNGVYGETNSTSSAEAGVYGLSTDASCGVYGRNTATGYGVRAYAAANNGVVGVSAGSSGGANQGVRGEAANGIGVYALNNTISYYNVFAYDSGIGNTAFGLGVHGKASFYNDVTFYGAKSGFVVDVAYNDGSEALERGDVVVISGAGAPVVGAIPVIKVRRASSAADSSVVGVVYKLYDPGEKLTPEEVAAGKATGGFVDGAAEIKPGQYLGIVTLGAFDGVKVENAADVKPGSVLTTSATSGKAAPAKSVTVEGVEMFSQTSVIGKALGAPDKDTGLVPIFVTIK
jgi:hypothetical protein